MDFTQLLTTFGPVVLSLVFSGGIVGFLTVIFNRRQIKAMSGKAIIEGEVARSGDLRAWADSAHVRAEKAETSAKEAWNAVYELRGEMNKLQQENLKLQAQLNEMADRLRDCATPGCSLRVEPSAEQG